MEADRRTCEKMSSLNKILGMLDKKFRAEGPVEFFRTPQPRLDGDRPMDLLGLPSAAKRIGGTGQVDLAWRFQLGTTHEPGLALERARL